MLRNLKSVHILLEILVRIALIVAFIKLETAEPFVRKILPDEIWIYRLGPICIKYHKLFPKHVVNLVTFVLDIQKSHHTFQLPFCGR